VAQRGRRKVVGRGERVLPGVWRLRLPLPWPGIPHGNAWALAAGDGIVLVDTGIHEPGSFAHLERALDEVGLRIDLVRLLVCTHAHSDHYGQAQTIVERTGCELWMHPAWEHARVLAADPDEAIEKRITAAVRNGLPAEPVRRYAEGARSRGSGIAGIVPPDRDLLPGVTVDTDLGPWSVVETPGHAPSHVCLYQPDRRLLISGDHLLGRVSLYFESGFTPDPVGEYLESLNVVDDLDMRLCLPGHGRTFTEVSGHVNANRVAIAEGLAGCLEALKAGPRSAFEVVGSVHEGEEISPLHANLWVQETRSYLHHLEVVGDVVRLPAEGEGEADRWALA
jgi:glyoxylase-like metal-dependent hydrolase (beta-lactamase superfamily II)